MGIGLLAVVSALALPRSHWAFGSAGGGDGFGILGLMIGGGLVFAAAVVTLVITEVVRAVIARKTSSEPDV